VEKKRRGGWPARTYKPGERVPMSFRVTPEFKAKLDQAAQQSGRSLIAEIEIRLDRSFQEESQLGEAISLGTRLGGSLVHELLILADRTKDDPRSLAWAAERLPVIHNVLKAIIAVAGPGGEKEIPLQDRFPQLAKSLAILTEKLEVDLAAKPSDPAPTPSRGTRKSRVKRA
jgi:hypothetical protein